MFQEVCLFCKNDLKPFAESSRVSKKLVVWLIVTVAFFLRSLFCVLPKYISPLSPDIKEYSNIETIFEYRIARRVFTFSQKKCNIIFIRKEQTRKIPSSDCPVSDSKYH